jgi:hypothetical protein
MVATILDSNSTKEVVARFVHTVDHTIELSTSASEPVRVAFDCEGVNLCRVGSVELVALAFDSAVSVDGGVEGSLFLVDLGSRGRRMECLAALRRLFESPSVVKVIHDCRMDCDALYHLHGNMTLENVHDTSCFHAVLTGQEDKNLNDVLTYNGVDKNAVRDKDVYLRNPKFWATRPLTKTMIDWASSDVDKLLVVANKQVEQVERRGGNHLLTTAVDMSANHTASVRDMHMARDLKCSIPIGNFIGPRGSHVRSLQKETNTMVYRDFGMSSNRDTKWLVFYSDEEDLKSVKREMGYDV